MSKVHTLPLAPICYYRILTLVEVARVGGAESFNGKTCKKVMTEGGSGEDPLMLKSEFYDRNGKLERERMSYLRVPLSPLFIEGVEVIHGTLFEAHLDRFGRDVARFIVEIFRIGWL